MNYLSIDVGTTACKCQLFSEDGDILDYITKEYSLKYIDGFACADITAIRENVLSMIKAVACKHKIDSICISTFGETFVALDKEDNILFDPMLYVRKRICVPHYGNGAAYDVFGQQTPLGKRE